MRKVAVRDKEARFTALLHHVDVDHLRAAYWALNPRAATGVDGVTWRAYGQDLERNLQDLHRRVQRGGYRARPARWAYNPKQDGRLRPLGIAALEDKLLQRAVVEVLNAIYEADFGGFSYGFRPGRSPHDALDALAAGIYQRNLPRDNHVSPTLAGHRGSSVSRMTRPVKCPVNAWPAGHTAGVGVSQMEHVRRRRRRGDAAPQDG